MERISGKTKLWCLLALLGVGLSGALFTYFGASAETAEWIVHKAGYFIVAATVIWFVYALIKAVRFDLPERSHAFWLVAAVALATGILSLHEGLGPKIAMDDYVLSSTAKSLAMEREVEVLTLGRNFNGYFIRADQYVDKRPWLYPFAVSVLHDLTGYRFTNGFLVNLGFGTILLSLTAMFGYRIGGLPAGVLGPFLWASLPLAGQNAMGGGLDMLNLLLLFLVLISGLYYIQSPDSRRLSLLSLAMVLLSYSRYESIIFWGPVLAIILIGWLRAGRPILSFALAASPALLIGLAALQNHIAHNPVLWELPGELSARFSVEYIVPNVYSALYYLLNFGDELSNSILLGLAGIPCVILFLMGAVKSVLSKDRDCFRNAVYLALAIGILGHFLVILAYHDGQLDEKISSRFALPLYLLFVVAILAVLSDRLKRPKDWWLAGVVVTIFLLGFTLPNKAKGIYSKRNFVVREAEWLMEQADHSFEPMSLVVDSETVIWTLMEWHCIDVSEAVSNLERLHAERGRGKFPEIYLVDRLSAAYDAENQIGFDSDHQYVGFEKTLIAERSFAPLRMTRIYKVGAIEIPEDLPGDLDPSSGGGMRPIEIPVQPIERDHPED